jgi:hypothetical protein
VKAAKEAKQAAKDAKAKAKMASIHRAAEFESNAMVNEDVMDATPRPNFNPKEARLATSDIDMSDGSDLDEHTYIPPEDSTEDDWMGSEGSAEETPMPLSKKGKGGPKGVAQAPKAAPKPLARSFAIADLADEAAVKCGRSQRMNIADDSATESDSVSPPPPTKKARAEGTAEQSVKITDGSATKSDSMPPLNKGKGKAVEKVEDKKPKKVKESIRNAIEAAQGKMTDGLDDDPRNYPSVDKAPSLKFNLKPKVLVKANMKSQSTSEPMRFGDGPQWVPKGGNGKGMMEQEGMGK